MKRFIISILLISNFCFSASQLEELYKDKSGFGIPSQEEVAMQKVDAPSTYGEITDEGVSRLMLELKPKKEDVFYDLGCGIGRMVVKVYLDTAVRKAIGIELSTTRSKQAKQVQDEMYKRQLTTPGKVLDFKEKNFLEEPLHEATIVYMASTCFSDDLLKKVMDKLAQEAQPGMKLISLRELPKDSRYKFIKSITLPMTWSKDTKAYIYELL